MTKEQSRKLKWKLEDKGYTYDSLTAKIGICKTSIYQKINGISDFRQEEIKKMVNLLNLNDKEIIEIFF